MHLMYENTSNSAPGGEKSSVSQCVSFKCVCVRVCYCVNITNALGICKGIIRPYFVFLPFDVLLVNLLTYSFLFSYRNVLVCAWRGTWNPGILCPEHILLGYRRTKEYDHFAFY